VTSHLRHRSCVISYELMQSATRARISATHAPENQVSRGCKSTARTATLPEHVKHGNALPRRLSYSRFRSLMPQQAV